LLVLVIFKIGSVLLSGLAWTAAFIPMPPE
jgi:hypothetical protein